ncbi:MAG: FAD-dependent oxidoreductase [Lachnospiraceae bacterium]|nr:FAD-dependent oxidoreductase [Lachnospiraceae bacterium]
MGMEQYEAWEARHKHDAPAREKVIKLGRKITDVAGHILGGVKVEDPEYWGLADIITDEMADIGLAMKKRHPYTYKELLKLNKITADKEAHFKEVLDEMCYIGLLEYDYGYHYDHNGRTAPQTERRYILPMFVPGSAELFNMEEYPDAVATGKTENKRLMDHPDLGAFFERMTYIPLAGITQMVPPGGAGIGMHVIPVEKAISMDNEAIDVEKLSYWLSKYEGKIGVGRCSCRTSRKAIGDGCADDEFGWCIGVGDFADYCRETGKGHDITKEEALAIIKRAEENGFVHQITNIDGENKIFGICNCNVEICNALRTSQLFNTPNMSRSSYVAHVDESKCVACGRCVEYCPAGATRLGQKLPKADGTKVKYPKQELPDAVKWGPEKYDYNYRDNNRINVHETGTSPCKTACPAHVAVQGYIKKASQGKYQEALALIKRQNPFPAVCGAVCNRRCEDACTRCKIDQSVSIDAIKRFIAEQDLNAETRYIPPVVIPASIHMDHFDDKIAIIGGGPAGMTAAFYLAEKGYKPTVFEKNAEPGGMLRYGIPSYKLDKKVLAAEIDVMKEMGVTVKTGIEVGKDITLDELRKEGYKAFYIAIGCSAGRRPGVPNDNAKGTYTAIDYLHEANCGDVPFNGRVVVVGGGNVAIDASRVSARSGAASVYQVCLESEKEMPASLEEITEAGEDGVKIKCGYGPKEVLTEDGKVTGIVFKKCLSVFNADHKFAPAYDENDTITIECDRVIFAVGQMSVWGDLVKNESVEFNGPAIKADKLTFQTTQPDIFVGGDVYTGPKFAIDAIAQGKIAAESLHRYVHNGHMVTGRNRWEFKELDKDDILVESYDRAPKQFEGINEELKGSFKNYKLTLTEEQIKTETARCLGCGTTVIDSNKCIGCGICTTKCAFDAITLKRDNPECSTMVVAEDKFKAIIPYQLKRAGKILLNRKKER